MDDTATQPAPHADAAVDVPASIEALLLANAPTGNLWPDSGGTAHASPDCPYIWFDTPDRHAAPLTGPDYYRDATRSAAASGFTCSCLGPRDANWVRAVDAVLHPMRQMCARGTEVSARLGIKARLEASPNFPDGCANPAPSCCSHDLASAYYSVPGMEWLHQLDDAVAAHWHAVVTARGRDRGPATHLLAVPASPLSKPVWLPGWQAWDAANELAADHPVAVATTDTCYGVVIFALPESDAHHLASALRGVAFALAPVDAPTLAVFTELVRTALDDDLEDRADAAAAEVRCVARTEHLLDVARTATH